MAKCACPSWWERYFLCKNRMLVHDTFIKNLSCPNLICMVYGNIIMQTKYESSLSHNKIRMLHVAFSIKRARASRISWSWEIFNKEEYIYTMVLRLPLFFYIFVWTKVCHHLWRWSISYLIQSSFFLFSNVSNYHHRQNTESKNIKYVCLSPYRKHLLVDILCSFNYYQTLGKLATY